jgi:ribosomal protein L3 glutamine methyltransferase
VAKDILRLFDRRVRERKPAAYLIREAWLGDLRFYVDERTIVPRSHIAALLQEALFPWIRRPGNIREVLDLCTGSGALAVLAAFAFPNAHIDAVDISGPALEVARRNVRAYRLSRRVRAIRSDLYSGLHGKRYDLVLCNPPYVTSTAMGRLPAEYRHEPRLALAGGADGLDIVRRILAESAAHLRSKGLLVVEVGRGRRRVEQSFPDIRFIWPESVAGSAVFLLERDGLPRAHSGISRHTR